MVGNESKEKLFKNRGSSQMRTIYSLDSRKMAENWWWPANWAIHPI